MIHFFYRLHLLVVFCFLKWQSLKHTLLLFLGHLSFVLLQRPLQVLVLLLGPAEGKGQKVRCVRGGAGRRYTHTQVTELVLPERNGRAPTFHLPGTLLVDGAANLEEILPMQVCCRACRTTAGWLEHNITCNVFLGDLWKCNDRQQTLLHKLTKEGWIFPDWEEKLTPAELCVSVFHIHFFCSVSAFRGFVGNLLFLLGIQVPDQRVSFVDQYDQLIQQQLLSSLLGLRLLPVCNDSRGTNSLRPGDSEDDVFSF